MLHTLTTTRKTKKRVGRGGARGKQAGRGHKGQKSRAGRRIRPALRDELQRIPKRRGYNKNRARGVRTGDSVCSVTLRMLDAHFQGADRITPNILMARRIIPPMKGRTPRVKVVARGDIAVPVTVARCAVSAGAQKKIEAAGGTVQYIL